MVMRLFLFQFFFIVGNSHAELVDLLDKDKMEKIEKIQTIYNDMGGPQFLDQIENYVTKQSKTKPVLKSKIDLLYEEEIKKDLCPSCDPYMALSSEVSKIIEKLDTKSDVYTENKLILSLNELKAMHYYVLAEQENGEMTCKNKGLFNTTAKAAHFKDPILVSEELLNIPNLTSLQYIPEGAKELLFIFKGQSNAEDSLIEVSIDKSNIVKVRYYKYTAPVDSISFPFIKEKNLLEEAYALKNGQGEKKDTSNKSIVFDPKLKFDNGVIPTDLELFKAKKSFEISDKVDLKTSLEANFKEQSANFSIQNENGKDYLIISAQYQHNMKTKLKTAVPFEIELSKEKDIDLRAEFVNYTKISNYAELDNTRTDDKEVSLKLSKKDANLLDFKYTTNEAAQYDKYTFSNEGNYYLVGPIATNYSTDSLGNESISISKEKNFGKRGNLTLEIGSDTTNGKFVNLAHQVKLGKTSSFAISTKNSEGLGTEALFQFKSKF